MSNKKLESNSFLSSYTFFDLILTLSVIHILVNCFTHTRSLILFSQDFASIQCVIVSFYWFNISNMYKFFGILFFLANISFICQIICTMISNKLLVYWQYIDSRYNKKVKALHLIRNIYDWPWRQSNWSK